MRLDIVSALIRTIHCNFYLIASEEACLTCFNALDPFRGLFIGMRPAGCTGVTTQTRHAAASGRYQHAEDPRKLRLHLQPRRKPDSDYRSGHLSLLGREGPSAHRRPLWHRQEPPYPGIGSHRRTSWLRHRVLHPVSGKVKMTHLGK